MNLYLEYHHPENIKRQEEIKTSILNNINSNIFKNIYIFCEEIFLDKLKSFCKETNFIKIVVGKDSKTFQDIFEFANEVTTEDDINIVINNDIELTDSYANVPDKISKNMFFCITRYENDGKVRRGHGRNTQDVWCWLGKTKIKNCNFKFGILGCDNTIAYRAHEAGYTVLNPSFTFVSKHHHDSQFRVRRGNVPRLPKQYYKTVNACQI